MNSTWHSSELGLSFCVSRFKTHASVYVCCGYAKWHEGTGQNLSSLKLQWRDCAAGTERGVVWKTVYRTQGVHSPSRRDWNIHRKSQWWLNYKWVGAYIPHEWVVKLISLCSDFLPTQILSCSKDSQVCRLYISYGTEMSGRCFRSFWFTQQFSSLPTHTSTCCFFACVLVTTKLVHCLNIFSWLNNTTLM